jgi:hypothetical protein
MDANTATATLFLVVAIMHLLRIIFGWQVEIGGLSIPFWASWLAFLWAVPSHTSASRSTDSRPAVAMNRPVTLCLDKFVSPRFAQASAGAGEGDYKTLPH